MNTIQLIRSDLHRYCGSTRSRTMLHALLRNRSFRYCFWLRLSNCGNPVLRWVARMVHAHLSDKYGIHIPPETRIGYGLYLGHAMSIVVNPTARIGNNCNLSQFTTIGSNHNKAAHIGDRVYIGPNVCIVEEVSIGSDSVIGAGSVVVHDVPAGTTFVGVPAREVGPNRHPEYIGNPWRRE